MTGFEVANALETGHNIEVLIDGQWTPWHWPPSWWRYQAGPITVAARTTTPQPAHPPTAATRPDPTLPNTITRLPDGSTWLHSSHTPPVGWQRTDGLTGAATDTMVEVRPAQKMTAAQIAIHIDKGGTISFGDNTRYRNYRLQLLDGDGDPLTEIEPGETPTVHAL